MFLLKYSIFNSTKTDYHDCSCEVHVLCKLCYLIIALFRYPMICFWALILIFFRPMEGEPTQNLVMSLCIINDQYSIKKRGRIHVPCRTCRPEHVNVHSLQINPYRLIQVLVVLLSAMNSRCTEIKQIVL